MKVIYTKLKLLFIGALCTLSGHAQVGQIIWEENFNSLNTDIWNITTGDGCDLGPNMCGWGNAELEYYHTDNVNIEAIPGETNNFALVLEAKEEIMGGRSFTSGKITSENNLSIKYGMIEVRMKTPDLEVGLWPAVWLLGTNQSAVGWPQCGEMDIMEMGQKAQFRADKGHPTASENEIVGSNLLFYSDAACADDNQSCAASIAFDNYYCTPYKAPTPLNDRYVIYRLYWDDKEIKFTVEDNGVTHNMYTGPFPIGEDAQEFKKPFYMILNLAVGGNFTDAATDAQVSAPLPAKMYVDYIRVRKWNGKGEVSTPNDIMANAGGNIKVATNDSITLDASGSYGNIQSYAWTIADTLVSTDETHRMILPSGIHQVKLTIADADGNLKTDEISVQVGEEEIGEIIWEENFDTFNPEVWNTITGNGCDEGPNMCGWGNAELEYYQPDNVFIEEINGELGNNALVLEARSETVGTNEFTSGKITTENKLAIKYGVVEVRMKAPDVESGLWPAAWMLGINHNEVGWPRCGEIDMMEMGQSATEIARQGHGGTPQNRYVGANLLWYEAGACAEDNPTCAASIAFDTWYDKPYVASTPLNDRFVIYRTYWDENHIRLTVEDNGVEYDLYEAPFPISEPSAAFRKPFYFILNLAVGGRFTDILTADGITAPMPAKMYVDYVRVRKWKGKGEVAFENGSAIANAGADQALVDEDKNGVELVTLDASKSYGNIVSYEWYEGGAQIALGENPTLEMAAGNHFLTLQATDANGLVVTDELKIDIREILWEENFNTLDTDLWNVITGNGCPELCGWGNAELEYYQEDNVFVEDITGEVGNKALVLEARSETVGNNAFTSGKVTTKDNMSIRYGLIEVRMQVPDLETGLWPAAWMLGINQDEVGWPRSGEIDIMEMGQKAQFREDKGISNASENHVVGSNLIFYSEEACAGDNQDCAASIAFDNYYCKPYSSATPLNDRFLTYRTYWDDKEIRFTVEDNGNEYDLYTGPFPIGSESSEFNKPFYLLLNLAVGGNFTDAATVNQVTAPLPAKMLVDYIRVMKWNGQGEIDYYDGLIADAGTDILAIDADGNKSEVVVLDGTGSVAYNGAIVSYSWIENGIEIATGETPEVNLSRATHNIVLSVTDDLGNTEKDSLVVVVRGVGLAPTADAGNDTTIYDDNGDDLVTFTFDGSKSFDTSDTIIAYSWIEKETEIASGINPTIDLSTGIHVVTLMVYNSDSISSTDEVIVTVVDPDNIAPVAHAGDDQVLNDDNGDDLLDITLDASLSTDSDGTIDNYSWLVNHVEIANGINPNLELSTGVYQVILKVTDNDGVSATDTTLITLVDPDNIAPLAQAGNDSILIDEDLDGFESHTLDASLSTDSDGNIQTYSWLENNVLIANEAKVSLELDLGLHTFVLIATDDDGVMSKDTVLIKVNQLPVAMAGTDIILSDLDENGSETYTLDASASYDPYGSINSYSWKLDGTEIGNTTTLEHTFNVGANEVSLTVTDDDGFSTNDNMVVFVARPDNAAPLANAGEDISEQEDDGDGLLAILLDGSASSDSDGSVFSYVWTKDSEVLAQGQNPWVVLEVGIHKITLTVTDNEGATSTDELFVTVNERINLALNKNTTTSSIEHGGTTGSNAVDGDISTRWASAFSDPQWIYVDLEANYSINQVILEWEAAFASAYEIQISEDAINWSTLFTETSGDGATDEITVNGTGRYLRVYGSSRGTEYGYSLFELEVYGTAFTVDPASSLSDLQIDGESLPGFSPNVINYTVTLDAGSTQAPTVEPFTTDENATYSIVPATGLPGETLIHVTAADASSTTTYTISFVLLSAADNLALNKSTVTSSDESAETTGSSAVDGDETTRWSSAFTDPQWIYVDLESNYSINQVVLKWEAAYANAYEIQISSDAISWATIYTETSGNGGTDDLSVSGTGRYIRVYGTSRATVYGYSLYELEVYGSFPTAIELNRQSIFKCFPNPVNNQLSIELQNKDGMLYLRDITGKVLKQLAIEDYLHTLDMQNYKAGLYFITVQENNKSATVKVIKK